MKPVQKWKCGECGGLHSSEDGAAECCPPDVSPVWLCGVCMESFDSEQSAVDCCHDNGEVLADSGLVLPKVPMPIADYV